MSVKFIRKFRSWKALADSVSGRAPLEPIEAVPTSTAEAQLIMRKMREDALAKVAKDGMSSKTVGPSLSPAVPLSEDEDECLLFPEETKEELLARCAKELNFNTQPFKRKFHTNPDILALHETQDHGATTTPIKFLNENEEENTIRVLQWNILSQTLGSKNDKFIRCNPLALEWRTRRWKILEEIIRYDPDIVCLQEVDHNKLIQKALGSVKYTGRFLAKPDSPCIHLDCNNGPDGCAIYFKKRKFEKIRKTSRVLKVWGARSNQVVMSMILRHRDTGEEICVVTTHLKAKLGELQASFRYEQSKDILCWLDAIRGGRPVIFSGDFNGLPSEAFYSTLTENPTTPLVSAYNVKPDQEDSLEYTTWKIRETGEQKYILDYIFHSPELETVSTLGMPSEHQVGVDRLPSLQFASDHLSLVADIKLM